MADFERGIIAVTFAANQVVACFEVPILEDDITEDNETFEIYAIPTVGGIPIPSVDGMPIVISVCIRDNDSVWSWNACTVACISLFLLYRCDIQVRRT